MTSDSKSAYRELCRTETSIPVFSLDWWLDAACGPEGWNVALVTRNGHILGALPYARTKQRRFTVLRMPALTQKLGPWLRYPVGASHYDRLTFEKDVMTELIEKLPAFDAFSQSFDYVIQNWLPFYWKGFQQTTRYTYVIDDIRDLNQVVAGFEHSKRKNIKRAEKLVKIDFDLAPGDFYRNHRMTLEKQGATISYSADLFLRLHNAAAERGSGTIICARDASGNVHSAIFAIWDANSAFDLISTIDPAFRKSGSASLLIRELIRHVADKTRRFDFEGSMFEPVEESFRRFGATQRAYFHVTKTNSIALRAIGDAKATLNQLYARAQESDSALHRCLQTVRATVGPKRQRRSRLTDVGP